MVASGKSPAGGRVTADEPAPAADIGSRIGELQSYVAYFVAAQVDRAKVIARNVIVFTILGVVGALVGAAVVVTAAVYLVAGVAGGLGALFGNRLWLGELVTALVILGTIVVGILLVAKRLTKTSRGKLVQSYEQRARSQRDKFGTDVHQQAGGAR